MSIQYPSNGWRSTVSPGLYQSRHQVGQVEVLAVGNELQHSRLEDVDPRAGPESVDGLFHVAGQPEVGVVFHHAEVDRDLAWVWMATVTAPTGAVARDEVPKCRVVSTSPFISRKRLRQIRNRREGPAVPSGLSSREYVIFTPNCRPSPKYDMSQLREVADREGDVGDLVTLQLPDDDVENRPLARAGRRGFGKDGGVGARRVLVPRRG